MRIIKVTKDGEIPVFITLEPGPQLTVGRVRDKILKVINSCENITHTVVTGKMIQKLEKNNLDLCNELQKVLYAKNRAIVGLPRRKKEQERLMRRRDIQSGRIRPTDDDIFPDFM